jgi:hypothetical protein
VFSAYTVAAHQLALEQVAGLGEPSLQIPGDRELSSIHDGAVKRTTEVRGVLRSSAPRCPGYSPGSWRVGGARHRLWSRRNTARELWPGVGEHEESWDESWQLGMG